MILLKSLLSFFNKTNFNLKKYRVVQIKVYGRVCSLYHLINWLFPYILFLYLYTDNSFLAIMFLLLLFCSQNSNYKDFRYKKRGPYLVWWYIYAYFRLNILPNNCINCFRQTKYEFKIMYSLYDWELFYYLGIYQEIIKSNKKV